MRHLLPFALAAALLPLGACAPAATAPPPAAPNSNRVIAADGRAASFGSGAEVYAGTQRIAAPYARAWPAVLAAFAATELPAERVDERAGQIASRFTVNGRIMGLPASTFLTCGSTMGVAEVADQYVVEVVIQVLLAPDGDATRMDVQLGGTARDRFTNTQARPCLTKGLLEQRLAARVRERLGLADPDAVAPLADASSRPPRLSELAADAAEPVPPAAEVVSAPSHPLLLAVGAVAGGAAGTMLGLQLGEGCEKRCFTARGTLGPLVANTVLIPLGAHVSNRRRGRLVNSFLVSAGWAAAATVVGGFTGEDWPVWVAAPGQALTSVLIEHASSRR